MPSVRGTGLTCLKSVRGEHARELGRRRKARDRCRQVRVRRSGASRPPGRPAARGSGSTRRTASGSRDRGAPNSRIASRPPASEHARELGDGRFRLCHVADAERDRRRIDRCRSATRDARGIATDQRESADRGADRAIFSSPRRSIAPAKSTPTIDGPVARRAAAIARSAVPVHRSSTRVPGFSSQRIDGTLAASGDRARR